MSSTTQPTTYVDLYTDLLNRTRQDTSTAVTIAQAKRYINIGLIDMHLGFGEKFPWAERRAGFLTHPTYSTGTLAISQGGISVVGAGTAFTGTNAFSDDNVRAGGRIRISGANEEYEVASTQSGTAMVLTSKFVPATVTAASYLYYEPEVELAADFLKPIDHRRFTSGSLTLELIGRTDFRRRFGQNFIPGRPQYATIIDLPFTTNTAKERRLVLHPPPDATYQFQYTYVTDLLAVSSAGLEAVSLSADTDEPIVPLRYRMAIVLHALYHWYRDKKDDPRSQEAKAEYVDLMSRVTGDTEIGTQKARIQPDMRGYRAKSRRPWGGSNRGRFDVNGRFDRLEW